MVGDFFSGVEQIEMSMGDFQAKLPLFYRKARCFSAVFPAKLWRLWRIMPDMRFTPAQILPGVGAVQLAAFEYYDVDVPPYNEFAICIPLNSPHFPRVPGYNLFRQMVYMNYDVYFHHLPVTTEVARRGGVDYYGFPKFLASIEFADTREWVHCELREKGSLICNLKGRRLPARHSGVMKFFCHTYLFRQPQVAEGKMNAQEYTMGFKPSNVQLILGKEHPIAVELSELLLSTKPLLYMYIPSFQMILYGPENLSLPLLRLSLESGVAPSLEKPEREKELVKSRK